MRLKSYLCLSGLTVSSSCTNCPHIHIWIQYSIERFKRIIQEISYWLWNRVRALFQITPIHTSTVHSLPLPRIPHMRISRSSPPFFLVPQCNVNWQRRPADGPGGSTSNSFDLHCDKSDSPRPTDTLCWAVPFIKPDWKLLVAIWDGAGHQKAGRGLAGKVITLAHIPGLSTRCMCKMTHVCSQHRLLIYLFIFWCCFCLWWVLYCHRWEAAISGKAQIVISTVPFYRLWQDPNVFKRIFFLLVKALRM